MMQDAGLFEYTSVTSQQENPAEYGRKLISATIAYDWLAAPQNFPQTVEVLIQ